MQLLSIVSSLSKYSSWCLFIFLMVTTSPQLAAANQVPSVIWDHSFGDDNKMYNAQAIDVAPGSGLIYVAGISSMAGGSGKSASFWFWQVNTKGSIIKKVNIRLGKDLEQVDWAYDYVKNIKVLDNNNVFIVAEYPVGNPFITIYDATGKQLLIKYLREYGIESVVINQILLTDDGLLLIGKKMSAAFIIKVTHKGDLLWKKEFDLPKEVIFDEKTKASFVDGVKTYNGDGYILLANIYSFTSSFYQGPSKVWLVKLDSKGNVNEQQLFLGRYGSISYLDGNKYGVVFDKSQSEKQDTIFKVVDNTLKELHRNSVYSSGYGFRNKFFIFGNIEDSQGAIMSGTTGHDLLLHYVDGKGRTLWEYEGRGSSNSRRTRNVVGTENVAYILTYINSENREKKANFKVGLIKLDMKSMD